MILNRDISLKGWFVFVLCVLVASAMYAQTIKEELVGAWKFDGFVDKSGNTVSNVNSVEGPIIFLNGDGTYTMHFTPTFKEMGKWFFSEQDQKIYYRMKIDTESFSGQYLIDNNLAIYEGGVYWDQIDDPLVSVTDSRLVVEDEGGKNRVYRKLTQEEIEGNKLWSEETIKENEEIQKSKDVVEEIIIRKEGNMERTYRVKEDGTEELIEEKELYEIKEMTPEEAEKYYEEQKRLQKEEWDKADEELKEEKEGMQEETIEAKDAVDNAGTAVEDAQEAADHAAGAVAEDAADAATDAAGTATEAVNDAVDAISN